MKYQWYLSLLLVVAGVQGASAFTNYYVAVHGPHLPPFNTWDRAATNIQDVVALARSGDIINLSNGTFVVTGQINVAYGITIRGVFGPEKTLLTGAYPAYTNRCFNVNDDGAWLDSLTISNFTVNGSGGGVNLRMGNMTNCHVTHNRTFGNGRWGGGVNMEDIWMGLVTHCRISCNTADSYGGGMGILGAGIIRNCEIDGNHCPNGGGAFFNNGVMEQCVIRDNEDGIRSSANIGSNVVVRNTLIMNNLGNGITMAENPFSIINCTIVSNGSKGVYLLGDTNPDRRVIINCIIHSNKSGNVNFSAASQANWFFNSCVGAPSYPLPANQGNITKDPLFVAPSSYNFRLQPNSPCINAGRKISFIGAADLDGRPRCDPFSGRVDMGAYEASVPAGRVAANGGAPGANVGAVAAALTGVSLLPFRVKPEVAYRELAKQYFWFHPRAAAMPGFGKNGCPAVIMTMLKWLNPGCDYYSGLYYMRTDDLGKTWTGPTEIPELAWRQNPDGTTISVADVTPGWHAPTGKLLAIGVTVRYSKTGIQLFDKPHSYEGAYAIFDPKTKSWTSWKILAMPDTETKFCRVYPACVQWLVKPDGKILLPVYFYVPNNNQGRVTVLECAFDGTTLTYLRHGDELVAGGGLDECSLAFFRGRYYLTIRSEVRGYVTASDDGLHFAPIKPWMYDDGQGLGNYNTQQHWLTHSDGLFLAYTRRGPENNHIWIHRAPLFLAQVDPDRLQVIRSTEQAVIPERGVPLGNFGTAAITPEESWVTDAELMAWAVRGPEDGDPLKNPGAPHHGRPPPEGADGSVWASRVIWSKPNQLVKP